MQKYNINYTLDTSLTKKLFFVKFLTLIFKEMTSYEIGFLLRVNYFIFVKISSMKIKFFIFISTVIFSMNNSFAQDGCNDEAFFLTKGSKWVYNDYKKNKLRWVSTNVLDTVKFFEDSTVFQTKVLTSYPKSAEGTVPIESNEIYVCKGNSILVKNEYTRIDTLANGFVSGGTTTITSPYLEIPNYLRVGQKLNGLDYSYYNNMIRVRISEREVECYEAIKTEAGTFKCYLITYNAHLFAYGIPINRFVKEWFSKEVGFVKTEYYNKKGKLKNSKVLVEFSK